MTAKKSTVVIANSHTTSTGWVLVFTLNGREYTYPDKEDLKNGKWCLTKDDAEALREYIDLMDTSDEDLNAAHRAMVEERAGIGAFDIDPGSDDDVFVDDPETTAEMHSYLEELEMQTFDDLCEQVKSTAKARAIRIITDTLYKWA